MKRIIIALSLLLCIAPALYCRDRAVWELNNLIKKMPVDVFKELLDRLSPNASETQALIDYAHERCERHTKGLEGLERKQKYEQKLKKDLCIGAGFGLLGLSSLWQIVGRLPLKRLYWNESQQDLVGVPTFWRYSLKPSRWLIDLTNKLDLKVANKLNGTDTALSEDLKKYIWQTSSAKALGLCFFMGISGLAISYILLGDDIPELRKVQQEIECLKGKITHLNTVIERLEEHKNSME